MSVNDRLVAMGEGNRMRAYDMAWMSAVREAGHSDVVMERPPVPCSFDRLPSDFMVWSEGSHGHCVAIHGWTVKKCAAGLWWSFRIAPGMLGMDNHSLWTPHKQRFAAKNRARTEAKLERMNIERKRHAKQR